MKGTRCHPVRRGIKNGHARTDLIDDGYAVIPLIRPWPLALAVLLPDCLPALMSLAPGTMLHWWRHRNELQDDWIGFTSYLQLDKVRFEIQHAESPFIPSFFSKRNIPTCYILRLRYASIVVARSRICRLHASLRGVHKPFLRVNARERGILARILRIHPCVRGVSARIHGVHAHLSTIR